MGKKNSISSSHIVMWSICPVHRRSPVRRSNRICTNESDDPTGDATAGVLAGRTPASGAPAFQRSSAGSHQRTWAGQSDADWRVRLCAAACAVFGAGTVLSEPSGTAQTGADPGGGLCPAVGRADGGALLDGGGQSERSSVLTLAEIWFALAVFCVGHLHSPGRLAVRQ